MLTLGILGGGQLGRMMTQAATRLGVDVRILAEKDSGAVAPFANVTVGDWADPLTLRKWAEDCDVVTVESEWAPAARLLEVLPEGTALRPHPDTLHLIRHKGRQNDAIAAAGLPLPPYARCATLDDARAAARDFGFPVMAKKFEGSYDGYGNATCHDDAQLEQAWGHLAAADGLLIEAFVNFEAEVAVQIARRADGESVSFPVCRTIQRDHRCHAVALPAGFSGTVEAEARRIASEAVRVVEGIGLTAVELFLTADGTVLVNELAPRPHNTGHASIDACHTSQFENHVRAVMGWPLGDTTLRVPAACMVNVLGHRDGDATLGGVEQALEVPGASVHLYGKREVRERRKMGHVTVTADTAEEARRRAEQAAARIRL